MEWFAEIWLPVVGHEGQYEVSDQGRVRSLDQWVNAPQNGGSRRIRGRMLRPHLDRGGHLYVDLGRNNRRPVHQLVAEAFIGPRNGLETRHGPLGKLVNTPDNLSYGTRADNAMDASWQRYAEMPNGTDHWNARLTAEIVREARARWADGEVSVYKLSREFGFPEMTLYNAIIGRSWAHVQDPGPVPVDPDIRHGAKLTPHMVREARCRRAAGVPLAQLADEADVTLATIRDAITGRTWKHVD